MATCNVKSGIFGYIVGNSLGVFNEYKTREYLKENMLVDMKGFGSYPVPVGTWTEASSTVLATIASIINFKGINTTDIVKELLLWLKQAKYTPFNQVLDVDETTLYALNNYGDNNIKANSVTKEVNNSALMRILPVAYYVYYKQLKNEEIIKYIKEVCSITHKNELNILGCYIYTKYIAFLLSGKDKIKSYNLLKKVDYSMFSKKSRNSYKRILENNIFNYKLKDINSTDNIVDSLEATMWCFLKANTYEEIVIAAVNLGDDTERIGALAGSLAGIYYGYKNIPTRWLEKIIRFEYINNLINEYNKVLKEKNLYKQLVLDI